MTGKHEPRKTIWALSDVSFEVHPGQTLGIIGHNGAGKSTLLRLICGIGSPTTGTIYRASPVSALLQLTGFHQLMSGRENIRTAGILSGLSRSQVEKMEDEMIAFAELEDFIDQPVRTYSEGMILRLAFTAAVHLNPQILVIDEILAVGDIRFKQKCKERLDQFRKAGKTLVLTSHSMEELRAYCDEILVLEQGKVAFHSDPASAIKHYNDLMRQRTEKRAAQLPLTSNLAIQKPQEGSRMGTQEASITAFHLYDERGAALEKLPTGSGLMIAIDFEAAKSIPDFAITLGIFTEKDQKCFETYIPSVRNVLGSFNGVGRIQCQMPSLPLLAGRYYVNLGLYPTKWEFIYDYHWQMHSFHVEGEVPNSSGVVSVHPVWSARS